MTAPHKKTAPKAKSLTQHFSDFARSTSTAVGSIWAFLGALSVILIWVVTGPIFHFSDTWQLVINTSTTIVTFLMVFLIQATQNRDARALHLKLDELIRAVHGARNAMVDLENLPDDELEATAQEFADLHRKACGIVKTRKGKAADC